jgi:hypothetical protein
MSDLDKLKKENKQLKALLKNAVELLDKYKEFLKHPEKLVADKKKGKEKAKEKDKEKDKEKKDKKDKKGKK